MSCPDGLSKIAHNTGTVTADTDVVSGDISLVKHPHTSKNVGSPTSAPLAS
ncbi:hypothetical protein [Paraburkholderia sp. BL17N1]|uniref:hypothetical protein n=1 Tax=Paraburkholderia sp. BL17N1 TaxID=1938798 RepID=UPI000F0EA0E6|nr:hypothetical protein [Paraburkholderia sp. BL17N1]RKR44582.1 hypothetical protein B0G82_2194 [Paraburkholderia sp. BL17N1]